LTVARELLGKHLVHQSLVGTVSGRIVETEAYAGIYDPASHTYRANRTERTDSWYGPGGYAYVFAIYGSYVCLGIITEPEGLPGAVLIRALEPIADHDLLDQNLAKRGRKQDQAMAHCSGPSRLCMALGIDKACNQLDLCGNQLYLTEGNSPVALAEILFTPRINIDYAGAGALSAWRYCLRDSPAISRKTYEPLRAWRVKGYPSQVEATPLDLFTHLTQQEEVSTMSEDLTEIVRHLPKVELHLHLEGCMSVATMRQLAHANQVPLPAYLLTHDQPRFTGFAEFVHTYYSLCQLLRQPQDFALVVADLAVYLRENAIAYCEVSWTPFLYLNRGFRFTEVMDILNEALVTHGMSDRVNFIIDIQRDHGYEAGELVFTEVFAALDHHIVGVGLTGQEEGFALGEYQELYWQAGHAGLGLTAHTGEFGTAADIRACVEQLGVTRIGHGLSAANDPGLMQELAACQIHLEICQTSNVRLERVLSYSSHPLRTFWQHQIPLSLNSDDPGLFGSGLTQEYLKATEHSGLRLSDLHRVVQHSLDAAFLPPVRKRQLNAEINRHWEARQC
jgi:adenosine deaminase